jgi:photosystem II stability/assembly factor-like uncharacterized protein
MNEQLPDDVFEERVRGAFRGADQPAMPASIRMTVERVRADDRVPAPGGTRRRVVIAGLVGVAALVAAVVGLSLSSGTAPRILPSGLPVSSGPSITPGPSVIAASGVITTQPWAGTFVPSAIAAVDDTHLVLVGATGDGIGDGVAAMSDDSGRGWLVRRLGVPALDGVTAAGSTIWATTTCSADAPLGCEGRFVVNTAGDTSWQLSPTTGLWHPTLLNPTHGWAVSPLDLRAPSLLAVTADGGTTWTRAKAPCRETAPGAIAVEFGSAESGWAACVGDTSTGSQAKELLGTSDAGATWSVLSAVSQDDTTAAIGSIPLSGQLGGISMRTGGHGWLWTDRGLYATADGGRTWTIAGWASSDFSTVVESAAFVGDDAGYAIIRDSSLGFGLTVVRTADGGKTWVDLQSWPLIVHQAPSTSLKPEVTRSAGFATASTGWALTDRGLHLTNDGGQTWQTAGPPVDYADGAPTGASFSDAQHGWVISQDTFTSALTLWTTANDPSTWSRTTLPQVPIPAEAMGDARIVRIDALHAVIDVRGGMPNGFLDGLLVTADGGATWTAPEMRSATSGADGITGDPAFVDPQTGWLAGGAPGTRLWTTRDGGDSWTLQHLAVPAGFVENQGGFVGGPRFFNRTTGVLVRSYETDASSILVIYTTSDGGRTWRPTTGANPRASSFSFVTPTDWIAWDSSNGRFWRSIDSGKTWSEPIDAIGLPADASPTMTDPDHGWTLSAPQRTIYVTSNGGSTWAKAGPFSAAP